MSEPETPPPAEPQPAAAPPVYEEYLASGARFRRWNLVSLILGLVCLAAGAYVVRQQNQQAPVNPPAQQERE